MKSLEDTLEAATMCWETWKPGDCEQCPYNDVFECSTEVRKDVLAWLRQLESERRTDE